MPISHKRKQRLGVAPGTASSKKCTTEMQGRTQPTQPSKDQAILILSRAPCSAAGWWVAAPQYGVSLLALLCLCWELGWRRLSHSVKLWASPALSHGCWYWYLLLLWSLLLKVGETLLTQSWGLHWMRPWEHIDCPVNRSFWCDGPHSEPVCTIPRRGEVSGQFAGSHWRSSWLVLFTVTLEEALLWSHPREGSAGMWEEI